MKQVKIRDEIKDLEYRDSEFYLNDTHFDGHFTLWRFEYLPKTYLKESELSGEEYRKGGVVKIYRDDICVLERFCREPNRAIFIIAETLPYLMDFMNWDTSVNFSNEL